MESKIKVLGHPAHQQLIVIPLGLLIVGTVFDVVYVVGGRPIFAAVSFWNIVIGVALAVVAAVFGLVDFLAIPPGTRAKRIGLVHGGGNVLVTLLFLVSALIRGGTVDHRPTTAAFALEIVALALVGVTAWLGGELVCRLGVGVYPTANLDAPSSLGRKRGLPLPVEHVPTWPGPHVTEP